MIKWKETSGIRGLRNPGKPGEQKGQYVKGDDWVSLKLIHDSRPDCLTFLFLLNHLAALSICRFSLRLWLLKA